MWKIMLPANTKNLISPFVTYMCVFPLIVLLWQYLLSYIE